jgi:hypothetical protein
MHMYNVNILRKRAETRTRKGRHALFLPIGNDGQSAADLNDTSKYHKTRRGYRQIQYLHLGEQVHLTMTYLYYYAVDWLPRVSGPSWLHAKRLIRNVSERMMRIKGWMHYRAVFSAT